LEKQIGGHVTSWERLYLSPVLGRRIPRAQRLVASIPPDTDAYGSVRTNTKRSRNYRMDFPAMSDYHDAQIHDIKRGWNVDMNGSGAIGIDVIRARAFGPLERWRDAIEYDVVHLGQLTVSIEGSHGYAKDREGNAGRGVGEPLYGKAVIAPKDLIRARSARGLCPGRGTCDQ
jgi:hypothetical protein